MLVTIDVGNTNITIGVFKEEELVASFRLTTKTPRTSDEFGLSFISLFAAKELDVKEVTGVIISSVVPKIMYSLTSAVIKYFKVNPMIVGPGMKTGIRIQSDNPKEVGADRIVNVVAAYEKLKKACLVIDFGTATTFDYISNSGVFEYTVITPGIEISAHALSSMTAKLPEIAIEKPQSILAKNTIHGMQAGLVYGYIGQVDYIVAQIKQQLGNPDLYVIATGGLGKIIAPCTEQINEYDPNIAFEGMKLLYEKNRV